jgi:uncharacterized protein
MLHHAPFSSAKGAPMAEDLIRYDILAQDALRGVVRKVLSEVAKTGLPGEHHFFISFYTRAPGVRLSQRLIEEYEKEMTIVLQNQFWDLKVTDTTFEVGLSFHGKPETLVIPFAAMKGFYDPSVPFGMQFELETANAAQREPEQPPKLPTATSGEEPAAPEKPGEKVVSLDSFRKKP